jgi:FixJ family two-component response regulator
MAKLKIAALEDNRDLLKELKQNLEDTGLVEVIAWARTSEEFLEKVDLAKPEALVLDIDLAGDSMSGLDIASRLKLPVLFVSGKTRDFYTDIEELNMMSHNVTVEHISKPITPEKLKKILPKFINEIRTMNQAQYVHLDFGDTRRNKISVDSIVCLYTDKDNGADSNNKLIYFTDRQHEVLVDFSFSKMELHGFSKNQFITIHKSFRVNADKILRYHAATHEVEVAVYKSPGKTDTKLLPVSENYRNDVSKFRR